MDKNFIEFTSEMKKDYTILIPDMLPMHFKMIRRIMKSYGYKAEVLFTTGPEISETGLRYVHNDTCYPAILVIGQLIHALQSGKYDPKKVALMLPQTGGGCRASNYVSLLRKALIKAGYGYIPVIPFGIAGLEKHSGWDLSLSMLHRMIYAVLYGDLLMSLVNQTRPYELNKGDSEALAEKWTVDLTDEMASTKIKYKRIKENYRKIVSDFAKIPADRTQFKPKVGIVGEIYVKFSALGNNNLEQFLVDEGAEPKVPGLTDFALYCVYNNMMDSRLYGMNKSQYPIYKFMFDFLCKKQKDLIEAIKDEGTFMAPTPIEHTISLITGYIGIGTKMGEGWLLTAEMLELYDSGTKNIICTQPFGCLPNHICGKGMMKPLKERNPDMNIVAIDYDAGATEVNQINRIKLMLANARLNAEKGKTEEKTYELV